VTHTPSARQWPPSACRRARCRNGWGTAYLDHPAIRRLHPQPARGRDGRPRFRTGFRFGFRSERI
jgi:hypothetical protein